MAPCLISEMRELRNIADVLLQLSGSLCIVLFGTSIFNPLFGAN
jgi:hypothetical protein